MEIGKFIPGNYMQQTGYKSFLPEKINRQWISSSPEVNNLLSEADRYLGELNAFSKLVPDVDFFISMHILKEATTSSRIEGTKTNMQDALFSEEDINPEKRDDWTEVQNYIKAINYSIAQLEQLPLSNRLLRNTHKILMEGVRGKHKQPGEFRKSQNWIGATLRDAIYIPPHHTEVPDLMSDLEKFIHTENYEVPHLIKIGIIHYQFETIHPFLDGNGRMGRLLITLYLVSTGLLTKPALYLSDFLEKNKAYYYDNLMIVRTSGNLEQWLKFFLVGIIETSKNSIQVFKNITALKAQIENDKFSQIGANLKNNKAMLQFLFQQPIIEAKDISKGLNVATSTANRLIFQYEKAGILVKLTDISRNRKYIFKEYLDIFQS